MNRPLHPYVAVERDTVRSHLVACIALDYDFDRMLPIHDLHDFGFLMDAPEAIPAGSCYSSISYSIHQSRAYRRWL